MRHEHVFIWWIYLLEYAHGICNVKQNAVFTLFMISLFIWWKFLISVSDTFDCIVEQGLTRTVWAGQSIQAWSGVVWWWLEWKQFLLEFHWIPGMAVQWQVKLAITESGHLTLAYITARYIIYLIDWVCIYVLCIPSKIFQEKLIQRPNHNAWLV